MKWLGILLLLWASVARAQCTPTVVQKVAEHVEAATGTSATVPFLASVASGHDIIVTQTWGTACTEHCSVAGTVCTFDTDCPSGEYCFCTGNSGPGIDWTDSQGNRYFHTIGHAASKLNNVEFPAAAQAVAVHINGVTTSDFITTNYESASGGDVITSAWDVTGLSELVVGGGLCRPQLDAPNCIDVTDVTPPTNANITTSVPNDLIWLFVADEPPASITFSTYTPQNFVSATGRAAANASFLAGAAGNYSTTFSLGATSSAHYSITGLLAGCSNPNCGAPTATVTATVTGTPPTATPTPSETSTIPIATQTQNTQATQTQGARATQTKNTQETQTAAPTSTGTPPTPTPTLTATVTPTGVGCCTSAMQCGQITQQQCSIQGGQWGGPGSVCVLVP